MTLLTMNTNVSALVTSAFANEWRFCRSWCGPNSTSFPSRAQSDALPAPRLLVMWQHGDLDVAQKVNNIATHSSSGRRPVCMKGLFSVAAADIAAQQRCVHAWPVVV
jgi:hypothetical protein